jgi:hypothetical protein
MCRAWWITPVIPAVGRLRQGDYEFKASLNYTGRPYLQKKEKEKDLAGVQVSGYHIIYFSLCDQDIS